MGEDLFVTGGSGFLCSHAIVTWLRQQPNARIACLVRAANGEAARHRLFTALARALDDQGQEEKLEENTQRITAIPGALENPNWQNNFLWQAWLSKSRGFHVLHGAANLSFRDEDRQQVWCTNVEGIRLLLQALIRPACIASFNYVSTAYVAGTREGLILEETVERPSGFNNIYEESKWVAEHLIRQTCTAQGIPYRIFRPSIIIGHSSTCRISANTGFYKVVSTIAQMARTHSMGNTSVLIPCKRNATLDLIPVDLVVLEMLTLMKLGTSTCDRTFHITNERPLTIADVFFGISPLIGLKLVHATVHGQERSAHTALVMRGIRSYLAYFNYVRRFDRRNVHSVGVSLLQEDYPLDLVRLREFVVAFLVHRVVPEFSQMEMARA